VISILDSNPYRLKNIVMSLIIHTETLKWPL